jgi:hypothetical protein
MSEKAEGLENVRERRLTRRTFLEQSSAAIVGTVISTQCGNASAISPMRNSQAPVLLRVSDAIKPGQPFSINGEWLDSKKLEILLSTEDGITPAADALRASIIQVDDEGHFIVALLPPQINPGIYFLWVRNHAGCSTSIILNQPRPLFLSEFEAWEGQKIQIVGRNFDPGEYGSKGAPRVRLADGGNIYEALVVDHNPFAITIMIPRVDPRKYWVDVSTDGLLWRRLPAEEGLSIVPAGKDPLDLGVAWADHFHWGRVFNVVDYGVPITGTVDVTAKVQAVVDTIKRAGGGVVYFPAGKYKLSGISLPADVILRGAGVSKSKLISTAVGGNFIHSTGDGAVYGHQGIAHLTVELDDPNVRPDAFFWLGEPWGKNNNVNDRSARTASELFLKNVNLDYPLSPPTKGAGQRGIGLEWIGKSRALCEDCRFVGYCAVPYINCIGNYYSLKRNYFEYCTGVVVNTGSRCFYENNKLVGRRQYARTEDDLHGLFARDRAYMANNVVEGMGSLGDNNDGEALCVEVPNAYFNCGSVVTGSASALKVSPQVQLEAPLVQFSYLAVAIVDGRGLGQLRRVTGVDSSGNSLSVTPSWDVVPDSTSTFTLILPLDQVTFYRNSIRDCWKGLWFFGNSYDSVQVENTCKDTEGVFVWTERNPGALIPGYFVRIARNTITGVSPKSRHAGVGCYTGQLDRDVTLRSVMAYEFEALENIISGVPDAKPVNATEAPPYSGLAVVAAATRSPLTHGQPAAGSGTNTILYGNHFTSLAAGITIDDSLDGTVIMKNTYAATVPTFLRNKGGNIHTVVLDNERV